MESEPEPAAAKPRRQRDFGRLFKRPTQAQIRAAVGAWAVADGPVLRAACDCDAPGYQELPRVGRGDWLSEHKEDGQTFTRYSRASFKTGPHGYFDKIGLVPIGDFGAGGTEAEPSLTALAELSAAYFGCKATIVPPVPAGAIAGGVPTDQLLAGQVQAHLLEREFQKALPRGTFCTVGVTMQDLTIEKDGEVWNFVFGQASLMDAVGVFSFARYTPTFGGDRVGSAAERAKLMLRRSARVLVHETGHIFGLKHCVHFLCVMNGHNSLEESDASVMHLCPVCLRKLHSNVGFDVVERYTALQAWYHQHGLDEEEAWVTDRMEYLRTTCAPCAPATASQKTAAAAGAVSGARAGAGSSRKADGGVGGRRGAERATAKQAPPGSRE
jgi:archaemetzincin